MTTALAAERFRRSIPKLAKQLGLNPVKLELLIIRDGWVCGLCFGALVSPQVYFVDNVPRAILCGYCRTAASLVDDDPIAAAITAAHSRTRWTRTRLARFGLIHAALGPFDEPNSNR